MAASVAACHTPDSGPHPKSAAPGAAAPGPASTAPPGWLPGDLHMHVAPPDGHDVRLDAAAVARAAHAAGLAFVILTPHLDAEAWRTPRRRAYFLGKWAEMARVARAQEGVTLVPGVEYSEAGVGHFGVSGVDLAALEGDDFLGAATRAGAFVVVNHPFALPTHIPGVRASEVDLSYRGWSEPGTPPARFAGVEIWNLRLALANVISRPGGETAEARALAAADAQARRERRHLVLVGGTDNHSVVVLPTTWVKAASAGAADVLAGLAAGATCVGGPEAASLEVHGDGDAADAWVGIGGSVHTSQGARLRFVGRARVFVDGQDQGEHDGSYEAAVDGAPHTFRIVEGQSRSGFVYANF